MSEWTDDLVEQLKKLWAEGRSGSEIGRMLGGFTRNAIIGKVHRIGLEKRAKPSRPMKIHHRRKPFPKAPCVPGSVKLVDLQSWSCRWPMGDPQADAFGFCGCPQHEGSSYCDLHHAMAHSKNVDRAIQRFEREAEKMKEAA
jgi:GcrA cell cycle regulator